MLKRALAPSLSDVHISWSIPWVSEVIQTPSKVPPVFSGDRLIIYGFLVNVLQLGDLKGPASLKGYIGTEKFELSINFEVKPSGGSGGKAVHQLAIKSLIKDVKSNYTDKDIIKKQLGSTVKSDKDAIVKLSTGANVICSHTSFVAVDEGNGEPVKGSMNLRHIPVAKDDGYNDCSRYMRHRRVMNFHNWEDGNDSDGYVRHRRQITRCNWEDGDGDDSECEEDDGDSECKEEEINDEKKTSDDIFRTIVLLQQASGAWLLDFAVARLVSKSVDDLDALSPFGKEASAVCKSIWATAVVLACLEAACAGSKDEWELIANKATKWAKKQTLPERTTKDSILGTTWAHLMKAAQKLFQ